MRPTWISRNRVSPWTLASVLLFAALVSAAGAYGVSWGSCALGANCGNIECFWNDHGYPGYQGDEPSCFNDPNAPPCYFCTYSQSTPTLHYGYCTQSPFPYTEENGVACADCRVGSWPGALPLCPTD